MNSRPNEYIARIIGQKTTSYDELIKRTTRRGLTITDTELIGAVQELKYALIDELCEGNAVETPFAIFRPYIIGPFNGKEDTFDSDRHSFKIKCIVNKNIKIDPKKLQLVKVRYSGPMPFIESFMDYASNQINSVITPGGTAEVTGELLKIDTNESEQGLFLTQNGSAIRIEKLFHNLPSQLIFNIPSNLEPGEYHLEIRNKTHVNSKSIKTYIFQHTLLVK